ncbi:hypothetical protein [Sabulicella glaciei]|uniref:EAL domain-containing protein n=1 Tax=Sabulicella glaciei TaxID=2984948 RepID=A0ABT3P1Q1_9PROT|nr:hypothetical protein [Roseococcus sp. MDT2-1-1]MCW8088118.1 hypothetical protein [Roseococcus sp. MDT2-1-1]
MNARTGTAEAWRDALALATLLRDCAASGVERRALHLRLSALPRDGREDRHRHLLREAMAPVLRPTRARLFTLPGGDLVALSPPPGEHLAEAREALARLLPEALLDTHAALLRLPAEAATLLTAVETALGLDARPPAEAPPPALPPPSATELETALRGLRHADLAAHLRRRPQWRLGPGEEEPRPAEEALRLDAEGLWRLLLPGTAPTPSQRRRFRHEAERRALAGLARPEEARQLGPLLLSLSLAVLEEGEFLRLEALLGPLGRADLAVAVPMEDALAEPGRLARLRRFAGARGWALGLDAVTPAQCRSLPLARQGFPLLRLRFEPALLALGAAERAALDASLPEARDGIVLLDADRPAAVAWGWRRGITRFCGALFLG